MKKPFSNRQLCRAAIIAALYVAMTYAFNGMAYVGLLQIRPAEALCVLPIFFPEAIPALYIGCMLSNLASPFFVFDVFIGSLVTLTASICTFFAGKYIINKILKILVGGFFPIILNALLIPVIIVFLCGDLSQGSASATYLTYFISMTITQSVWIYGLGIPLYFFIYRMREKKSTAFCDNLQIKNQ